LIKKNQTFSAYLPELGLTKAEYRAQTWINMKIYTKVKRPTITSPNWDL